LEQASCYLEQSLELRRKVVAALTYPVVLICASVLVLAFLLTFVMPKFMKLFDKMKVQLPATTKALLAVSNFLVTKWYIPIIATVVLLAFFVWMRRTERGRLFLARLFGKIPLVGDLALKIAVARLLSAMGAMLQAGVPLMGALQTGADTSGHLLISKRIRRVKERVQEGASLSEAAAEGGELPPLAIQMMAAGEKTGKLAEILPGVGAYYEREVEARVRSLTSILEPLMILGLGIVIGFITVSIISPIYTLVGSQR
jgi:type IV pilus assembly protein PilC